MEGKEADFQRAGIQRGKKVPSRFGAIRERAPIARGSRSILDCVEGAVGKEGGPGKRGLQERSPGPGRRRGRKNEQPVEGGKRLMYTYRGGCWVEEVRTERSDRRERIWGGPLMIYGGDIDRGGVCPFSQPERTDRQYVPSICVFSSLVQVPSRSQSGVRGASSLLQAPQNPHHEKHPIEKRNLLPPNLKPRCALGGKRLWLAEGTRPD